MDSTKNLNTAPKVKKETKNKIRVDFERTDLKTRLKAKFVSAAFLGKVIFYIFRLVLLVGLAYIILYPFITKISGSFMSKTDFADITVRLIPRNPTWDTYIALLTQKDTVNGELVPLYLTAFKNTLILSLTVAILQTFTCCLIAYGLAKFRFKGNALIFAAVVLTMIIPHSTLQFSFYMNFRYFDIFGIFKFLSGGLSFGIPADVIEKSIGTANELSNPAWIEGLNNILAQINILPDKIELSKTFSLNFVQGTNLINTYAPMVLMSLSGLAFKNGLYIFMLRQFFSGIPDSLEESAYIDGSGTFRTFLQIILPMSVPMMITVFIFAFSWQWTDDFYTTTFFPSNKVLLMPDIISKIPPQLQTGGAVQGKFESAIVNTSGLLIIMPLVIMYVFCQQYIIQGIERSGITGE